MINAKKIFLRLLAYLVLFPYLVLLSAVCNYAVFNIYAKLYFHKSYIKSINTPSYSQTAQVLQEFSDMSNFKIVSFDEIENGRPITIEEIEKSDNLDSNILGIAYISYDRCQIKLRKNLSNRIIRETIIHEYLHCYGYEHSIKESDLMYYSLNRLDKEENIRQYAIKVRKEFYE